MLISISLYLSDCPILYILPAVSVGVGPLGKETGS